MPRSGARLPKSEATRLKLLECASQEVLEVGADNIGFTSIARRAQMSTGALYARYENSDELLIELWTSRCLPGLRSLVADMIESMEAGAGKPARRRIADLMSRPDPDLAVMVEVLVLSRRNEAIGETVVPTMSKVVEHAMTSVPAFDFYLGQVLGIVLGVRGTGLVGLDWYGPVSIVASATRDARDVIAVPEGTRATPSASGPAPELDDVDTRLFDAVTHVVSRAGVDNATISRIARRADVNPASIYVRYEDKNALFRACFDHIMSSTHAQDARLLTEYREAARASNLAGSHMLGVSMFRGNQSAGHMDPRRLRLEIMVGAAHHDYLRAMTGKKYHEVIAGDAALLGVGDRLIDTAVVLPHLVFGRFAFFGQALLREHGFLDVDHPLLVSYFDQLSARVSRALESAG